MLVDERSTSNILAKSNDFVNFEPPSCITTAVIIEFDIDSDMSRWLPRLDKEMDSNSFKVTR